MTKKILIILAITFFIPVLAFSLNNRYQSNKQIIYTKNAPEPIGPYSQAVKIANVIYISGQIPIDAKTGELVAGDFYTQANQAITNLSEITKEAGGNLDDIVKVTVYMTDLSNFAILNKVMMKYFHKPYPARVAIEVKGLPKHASIEIEAIMQAKK